MGSSAQQGFVDPYNYSFGDNLAYTGTGNVNNSIDWGTTGIPGSIANMLGFDLNRGYDQWSTMRNQEYERQSIQSARAWSEYMDNTQYQRRVADLKAAGLNPWLAVQNGISGSGSPSADTGGSAQHQTKSGQSKTALGMILMALAKLLG